MKVHTLWLPSRSTPSGLTTYLLLCPILCGTSILRVLDSVNKYGERKGDVRKLGKMGPEKRREHSSATRTIGKYFSNFGPVNQLNQ